MFWSNFLHIYQPPTQKELWVRRIADESYRKITRGLLEIPRTKITLNINAGLCELLERYGASDVLRDIKKLLLDGRLELTGSAKYHPFLPAIPELEIERQIKINEETLDKYFSDRWRFPRKRGFFPPEMAYSKKVAEVASRLGYEWIIIDELALPHIKKTHGDKTYTIIGLKNFGVFFRERNLSFAILSSKGAGALPTILRYLGDRLKSGGYALTAMDGETFGHHRPGLEVLLFDIMKSEAVTPVTVSDLFQKFPIHESIEPLDSTWASTKRDMKSHLPFLRWQNKDNPVQKMQWQLTHLAIAAVNRVKENQETRKMLDAALHSDQYWWASAKPWWSLEMIERGAYELKEVILKSPGSTKEEKAQAQELYRQILFTGFEWQRTGRVDAIARQENEQVEEMRELKEKLFITKAEYRDMIRVLEEQVQIAAKNEEFHRAAMIKDRIRELKEEMEKAEQ